MAHTHSFPFSFGSFMLLWTLVVLAIIAVQVHLVIELADCSRRQFASEKTRLMWLLIMVLGPLFGAVLYHVYGRSQGCRPTRPG